MQIILVRHAQVEVEPGVAPSLWQLSDEGRSAARRLSTERLWWPVGRIFSSPELKAFETAHILAGYNGITVTAVEDLHEVARPADRWFDDSYPGGYAGAVRDYFSHPDEPVHGWEPAADAQRRMRACLDELRGWEPDGFAVAGHGLTLSLYVASVTSADPAAIWPTIALPDHAVLDVDAGRLLRPFGLLAMDR